MSGAHGLLYFAYQFGLSISGATVVSGSLGDIGSVALCHM